MRSLQLKLLAGCAATEIHRRRYADPRARGTVSQAPAGQLGSGRRERRARTPSKKTPARGPGRLSRLSVSVARSFDGAAVPPDQSSRSEWPLALP